MPVRLSIDVSPLALTCRAPSSRILPGVMAACKAVLCTPFVLPKGRSSPHNDRQRRGTLLDAGNPNPGETQMTGPHTRYNKIVRTLFILLCFALCFVAGAAFNKYVGLYATFAFVRSPVSYVQVRRRDWNSFQQLQYTQDHGGIYTPRYVDSVLLPLVINEKRLSDSYPVAKFGGAIAAADTAVLIVDRLGSLYRYDLTTSAFEQLRLPPLPNNLQAYLHQRPSLDGTKRANLASAEAWNEFRTYDITFLSDRRELAVSYDQFDATLGKLRTAVSVIPVDVITFAATGDWRLIFTSDPYAPGSSPFGSGRMAYRGDDKLYLTLGDHGIYTRRVAQDSSTTFGKIIEIDLRTKIWREISKGLRNPQGLTFAKSGQLIFTEQGPQGGDELGIVTAGSNYGWPDVTLGTDYGRYAWNTSSAPVGRITGYTAPLFAWVPSIAVSQIIEINSFDPRWNADLLVSSLKALSLYRLRLEGNRVLYSEPIWIGQRIRDLVQTKDGTIVLWTDDTQLLFVSVDRGMLTLNRRMSGAGDAIESGGCLGCHHFGLTNLGDPGPTLSDLLDRPIASDIFPYSPGLRARHGKWTKDLLVEFLTNPSKFANGTAMPTLGLDPEQIENIVDALARAPHTRAGLEQ
jgi:cytochrome c2